MRWRQPARGVETWPAAWTGAAGELPGYLDQPVSTRTHPDRLAADRAAGREAA